MEGMLKALLLVSLLAISQTVILRDGRSRAIAPELLVF